MTYECDIRHMGYLEKIKKSEYYGTSVEGMLDMICAAGYDYDGSCTTEDFIKLVNAMYAYACHARDLLNNGKYFRETPLTKLGIYGKMYTR